MPGPDDAVLLQEWLHSAASTRPDHAAVVEGGRVLTFGQLQQVSASLAAAFCRRGLEPGDRVALLMEKSADAVVAVYGTLMAGGAFVPIPPDWPPRRIEAVIEDCDARLIVADPEEADDAPTVIDRRSGVTLPWREALATLPSRAAAANRAPEDCAFILFTSGSTGPPKGVTISHRAVGAFVDWSADHFQLSPEDRIVCPSPLSFDLSTFDVFNIARSGSTCVIAPRAATWVPRLVLELARQYEATVWYSVPSLLVNMMDRAGLEQNPLSRLRVMLFAGEVMPPREAARLRAAHPQTELYNLYGPTETNVVTWHRLGAEVDPRRPVPIGQPCPYARVRLEPTADDPGVGPPAGLLLVAGDSLMSGYWNKPEETARAFAEVDEGGESSRYYRTGDRVVQQASGELLFMGRADRQVKRRGYRVELAEIEAALGTHPSVAEVAVIAAADGSGRVSAFICPRDEAAAGELELRAHCALFLPPYMIPDRFLILPEIPRGDRGKIDYHSLARLEQSAT